MNLDGRRQMHFNSQARPSTNKMGGAGSAEVQFKLRTWWLGLGFKTPSSEKATFAKVSLQKARRHVPHAT